MGAGAVPELTIWGGQAHLLLCGGRLGLGVPSCLLLCLSLLRGTVGWSQPLCYILFSGVGHFHSC